MILESKKLNFTNFNYKIWLKNFCIQFLRFLIIKFSSKIELLSFLTRIGALSTRLTFCQWTCCLYLTLVNKPSIFTNCDWNYRDLGLNRMLRLQRFPHKRKIVIEKILITRIKKCLVKYHSFQNIHFLKLNFFKILSKIKDFLNLFISQIPADLWKSCKISVDPFNFRLKDFIATQKPRRSRIRGYSRSTCLFLC